MFLELELESLCRASGGDLRDLFLMIRQATVTARLRQAATVSSEDSGIAVTSPRNDYKGALGNTGEDTNSLPLEAKLDRLVELYRRETRGDSAL